MTMTDTPTAPISHTEAMQLQRHELDVTVEFLRSLDADDWATHSADCPDWDIHKTYLHVLGACEAGARMRENIHQLRAAYSHRRHHGGPLEAALSNVQVRERLDLSPDELVERLAAVAPATITGRGRVPGPVRKYATLKIDGPVHETWKLGYLVDTIYLRDMWMHRVDASRATGRSLRLTADHDGRIVADVVAEWARRHGQPYVLELEGPAGGAFADRADDPAAERHQLDAIEFCRVLSGRGTAHGLLETIVPF